MEYLDCRVKTNKSWHLFYSYANGSSIIKEKFEIEKNSIPVNFSDNEEEDMLNVPAFFRRKK